MLANKTFLFLKFIFLPLQFVKKTITIQLWDL